MRNLYLFRHLIQAAAFAGLVGITAGCAAGDPTREAGAAVFEATEGVSAEDISAAQALGDRLFGAAGSLEVRQARQTMAVAGYAFLLAERVTRYDAAIAGEAQARMDALAAEIERGPSAADEVFAETALGDLTLELATIAVDTGLERGTRLAGLIATLNPTGLLTRARVAARQGFYLSTLVIDIKAAVARMNEDPGYVPAVEAASRALLCESRNRVRAMTGSGLLDCSGGPALAGSSIRLPRTGVTPPA